LTVVKTAAALVDKAIASQDIYCAAAVHSLGSRAQQVALEQLMFSQRRDALSLASWEHTPASVLQALASHIASSGDRHDALKMRLDKNANTPALALSQLYASNTDCVKAPLKLSVLIAQHNNTPTEVLEKIVRFVGSAESLRAVSQNPAATAQLLSLLLQQQSQSTDYALLAKNVAANPATSSSVLEHIYAKGDVYARAAVIAHKHCPLALLKIALVANEHQVLRHLAADARLSAQVLGQLASNQDQQVRCAVATNMATPQIVIKRLINDSSPRVRRALASRTDLNKAFIKLLAKDADDWVRQRLARNPNVPGNLLKKLLVDVVADVRRAVARNVDCPVALLKVLAKDSDAWVRAGVSYQPKAPKSLMLKLAKDTDIDVLSGVAHNPHTPSAILHRLAASAEADVRRGVIMNSSAKRHHLLPMLEDPYYLHRLMLVGSHRLYAKDKWPLCDDPDFQVRFMAYRHFATALGAEA
jgi:hypothetical protein